MDDTRSLTPDLLSKHLTEGAEGAVLAELTRLADSPSDERRSAVRAIRQIVDEHPDELEPLLPGLIGFLTDDERSIRLTTAKLFVAIADRDPGAVVPLAADLAERVADDDEFYYVRARSAEALGYVALKHPGDVASPELLADLRVGLSFDEPEVEEKLAKALAFVALGDPNRLGHQVSNLAEHLDAEQAVVRYHLVTAIVAVGCECPEKVAAAREALVARLHDEDPHVCGRAAEALGLLSASVGGDDVVSEEVLADVDDGGEAFVADRVRFAQSALGCDDVDPAGEIGSVDGIRQTTDAVVEAIAAPASEGECPNCGLSLPEHGPPTCPQCGGPY